eukprot:scaffold4574_cov215-Prasinococcus_capsulatus_cf.AAC.1
MGILEVTGCAGAAFPRACVEAAAEHSSTLYEKGSTILSAQQGGWSIDFDGGGRRLGLNCDQATGSPARGARLMLS